MPKGIPAAGFRRRGAARDVAAFNSHTNTHTGEFVETVTETDEEIETRLNDAFDVLSLITQAAVDGHTKAIIVSGAPGLGKSYTVEDVVGKIGERAGFVKGFARPTGIYKTLYEYKHSGNVVVFDDCDSVFSDETALNLLKAACDSLDTRRINWGAETNMISSDGSNMPRQFEFDGAIIFITNLDFEAMIASGNKLAPHLEALMSRAHYINLGMKGKRDYLVRIKQVIKAGMLLKRGVSEAQQDEILSFIWENVDKFRELSLRMVIKASDLFKSHPDQWKRIAASTLFKSVR